MNTFYGPNDYRSYLEHHGVLGMKWGKRKQYEVHPRKTEHGLTDKQKKYIKIGAAIAGTALLAYGAYKLSKRGNLVVNGVELGDDLKDHAIKSSNISKAIDDVVTNTNPLGLHNCCPSTSNVAILRLRGYNAEAIANPKSHNFTQSVTDLFKISEFSNDIKRPKPSPKLYDDCINSVKKMSKPGDFGRIGFEWNDEYARHFNKIKEKADKGFGHTLNWINEDENIRFFDGMPSNNKNVAANMNNVIRTFIDTKKEAEIVNLTNAEIIEDAISDYAKIRR